MCECTYIENCGFLKKYKSTSEVACKGFISMYCTGPNMEECKRKIYRVEKGEHPPSNLLPNGKILKSAK